jgi:hypothetical protein
VALAIGAASGVLASRWSAQAAEPPLRPVFDPALEKPPPPPPREPAAPPPTWPTTRVCGRRDARTVSFKVSVQQDLAVGAKRFASQIRDILCDERGWTASGAVRFRFDRGAPITIALRGPKATEARCWEMIGLSVRETYSCAGSNEAALNADRWFEGSPTLTMSVQRYRHLLVNHEVGHLLGHGHRGCSGSGERAPVMMQQSKGLDGCRANPWPLGYELGLTR